MFKPKNKIDESECEFSRYFIDEMYFFRYLAIGAAFRVLAFHFMRGEKAMGIVIEETTAAIWKCFKKQYMPLPSEHMWIEIVKQYEKLWNMPNCISSIEGKHVLFE